MQTFKKWLCLILSALTLVSVMSVFTGCANDGDTTETGDATHDTGNRETGEVDNRFVGVNYGGREFRIYTSINVASAGMGNSNFLIEGEPDTVGNMVNDAVLERNVTTEELLGVKLVFTQTNADMGQVPTEIQKYTLSGDDEFDLVINDMFGFANLVINGHFRNVLDENCVFDFDRDYWYKDFMEDLSLTNGYQYMLAGDYFVDVIRSAHLLLVNKEIYRNYYNRSADELYDTVSNYQWTFAKLNEIITGLYVDKNLNNKVDIGDQFGYMNAGSWGYYLSFAISGNPPYITRDEEGIPTITLHEGDRANQLANALSIILHNESTTMNGSDSDLLSAFTRDECLVVGYQRMGSLENPILRSMEGDAAVLPYPMLFESDQKYVTSAHDTSEVGAILITSKDTSMEFISTVTEVLCRETANILMPKYYKESLQVQCVDDPKAAAMIDIIHDNFDHAFILAYNSQLGNKVFAHFFDAADDGREFSVVFAGTKKSIAKTLSNILKTYHRKNNIN